VVAAARGRELSLGPRALYPVKALITGSRSVAWLLRTGGRPRGGGIRILYYHRVAGDRDELAVPPRAFAAQMEAVARAGLRGVRIDEVVAALGRDEPVVGLSFDDGYADVAEHALPVLERLGFRATVFVATGVTDGRARFGWYGDDQPALLGWDEIGELDRAGTLRFEAHTVTHPNLLSLGDEDARREIFDSKSELERRLARPVDGFCYPAGLFGDRERALTAEAGFRWAASCERGVNTPETDRLALRRVQVDGRDSLLDVRAKLHGGHDTALPLQRLYRRVRYGASTRS
jgi:peptidoglycan/xylan/chitin deacetylase (PgdA/CDA1 family)